MGACVWLHEEPSGGSGSPDGASREPAEVCKVAQGLCFCSNESLAKSFYSFPVQRVCRLEGPTASPSGEWETMSVDISGGAV